MQTTFHPFCSLFMYVLDYGLRVTHKTLRMQTQVGNTQCTIYFVAHDYYHLP